MCSGSEAGSYLRLIDSCITQFKAQGPSWTCNESREDEEGVRMSLETTPYPDGWPTVGSCGSSTCGFFPKFVCRPLCGEARNGSNLECGVVWCHGVVLYHPDGTSWVIQKSMSLKYEPASEPLHI